MTELLKIRPVLWYALICALAPTEYKGGIFLNGVVNELVAPEFPYSKHLFIVIGWQRGLGPFDFYWRLVDEDNKPLGQCEPLRVTFSADKSYQLTMQYTLTANGCGYYLFDGFLDGEKTFTTILRVSLLKQA